MFEFKGEPSFPEEIFDETLEDPADIEPEFEDVGLDHLEFTADDGEFEDTADPTSGEEETPAAFMDSADSTFGETLPASMDPVAPFGLV